MDRVEVVQDTTSEEELHKWHLKIRGRQRKQLSPQDRRTAHTRTHKGERIFWHILDVTRKSVLLVHKELGGREW